MVEGEGVRMVYSRDAGSLQWSTVELAQLWRDRTTDRGRTRSRAVSSEGRR